MGMTAEEQEEHHFQVKRKSAAANFGKHNWRTAKQLYTELIEERPSDPKLYSNRSACFVKTKHWTEALADADKTVALDPSWAKGHYRRGCALQGLGREEDGIEAFNQAAAREPAGGDASKAVALAYARKERLEREAMARVDAEMKEYYKEQWECVVFPCLPRDWPVHTLPSCHCHMLCYALSSDRPSSARAFRSPQRALPTLVRRPPLL